MKRAYEVRVERGENMQAYSYIVVAASDEEAVRKAKRRAQKDGYTQTGWRCVELRERSTDLVR